MKSLFIARLISGIIFISSFGYSYNSAKIDSANSKICLEVVGIAIGENNEPIDGVEVKLLKENEEMEWVDVTEVTYHDHNFTFALEENSYYTIEVSKPGYVTRSIGISTKLPGNVDLSIVFKYGFEVVLFPEKDWIDDFYLDFPVALVSYNPKSEVFENNSNYTRHIKTKIKESEGTSKSDNYDNYTHNK